VVFVDFTDHRLCRDPDHHVGAGVFRAASIVRAGIVCRNRFESEFSITPPDHPVDTGDSTAPPTRLPSVTGKRLPARPARSMAAPAGTGVPDAASSIASAMK
jgi:hypothetical protein